LSRRDKKFKPEGCKEGQAIMIKPYLLLLESRLREGFKVTNSFYSAFHIPNSEFD
jgi:hypothetical protein